MKPPPAPSMRVVGGQVVMIEPGHCTPGCEWSCATAASPYCHCACGGKNHGKFRQLAAWRKEEGPWTAFEARQVLDDARAKRREVTAR